METTQEMFYKEAKCGKLAQLDIGSKPWSLKQIIFMKSGSSDGLETGAYSEIHRGFLLNKGKWTIQEWFWTAG